MRGFLVCTVALLALPTEATAADKETVLLPSSAWHLDYEAQSCRLSRSFGSKQAPYLIYFEQGYPSALFGLTLGGPGFGRVSPNRTTIQFGTNPVIDEALPFRGTSNTVGEVVIYTSLSMQPAPVDEEEPATSPGLPRIDPDAARNAEFVEFAAGRKRLRFVTGNLAEPMAALDACSVDLIRVWGLDVEKHKTMLQQAQWINRDSVVKRIVAAYPGLAEQRGEQAIVWIRVIVDEMGAVSECHIEKATVTKKLESPACDIMQRAKFSPALDAKGAPMKSYYTNKIIYRIG